MSDIVDLHCHLLPKIDDGSDSINTSIEMIKRLSSQGIKNIFCTSHGDYVAFDVDAYKNKFIQFRNMMRIIVPDINLYCGAEVYCDENVEEVIEQLKKGSQLTLNDSKYVLTEFYIDVVPEEILFDVKSIIEEGFIPIIAHIERYSLIFDGKTIDKLIEMGALIQVNAYSYGEGITSEFGQNALQLLPKKQVHFLGSDAHNISWRAPLMKKGINYLKDNLDREFFEDITKNNALKYLKID